MGRENYFWLAKSVDQSDLTLAQQASYVRNARACGTHIECPVRGDWYEPTLVVPPSLERSGLRTGGIRMNLPPRFI